jgi:hypothetical protein
LADQKLQGSRTSSQAREREKRERDPKENIAAITHLLRETLVLTPNTEKAQ